MHVRWRGRSGDGVRVSDSDTNEPYVNPPVRLSVKACSVTGGVPKPMPNNRPVGPCAFARKSIAVEGHIVLLLTYNYVVPSYFHLLLAPPEVQVPLPEDTTLGQSQCCRPVRRVQVSTIRRSATRREAPSPPFPTVARPFRALTAVDGLGESAVCEMVRAPGRANRLREHCESGSVCGAAGPRCPRMGDTWSSAASFGNQRP
jgi:hypothetical protein